MATLDATGQRTALTNSWGSSTFGYDADRRLTSASLPNGVLEQNQYDASGNHTVITSTTTLTNSASVNGGEAAATAYGYDGVGEQTGSVGPLEVGGTVAGAGEAVVRIDTAQTVCAGHGFVQNLRQGCYRLGLVMGDSRILRAPQLMLAWDELTQQLLAT